MTKNLDFNHFFKYSITVIILNYNFDYSQNVRKIWIISTIFEKIQQISMFIDIYKNLDFS